MGWLSVKGRPVLNSPLKPVPDPPKSSKRPTPNPRETPGSAVCRSLTSWVKMPVTAGTRPAKLPVSSNRKNTSTLSITEDGGKEIETGTVSAPPVHTADEGGIWMDEGFVCP